jgi:hypothetical protein
MMIALLNTGGFSFLAAGKTVAEARNTLRTVFERHCKFHSAQGYFPPIFAEVEDLVEILVDVEPGKAFLDGDEI